MVNVLKLWILLNRLQSDIPQVVLILRSCLGQNLTQSVIAYHEHTKEDLSRVPYQFIHVVADTVNAFCNGLVCVRHLEYNWLLLVFFKGENVNRIGSSDENCALVSILSAVVWRGKYCNTLWIAFSIRHVKLVAFLLDFMGTNHR